MNINVSTAYLICFFLFLSHCNKSYIFRTFDVNVKAALNISQIIARKMVDNKTHGAIVNISSQASKVINIFLSCVV